MERRLLQGPYTARGRLEERMRFVQSYHRYYGPFEPIVTHLDYLTEIGIVPCTELVAVMPPTPIIPDPSPPGNDNDKTRR